MASMATYAKLTLKQQFRPDEDAIFRLEYSKDLMNDLINPYGTLVIDGYYMKLQPNGNEYEGTKITHSLHNIVGGQPYEEFVVPAGTLGATPLPEQSWYYSGKMQARVEIGSELSGAPLDNNNTQNGSYVVNPVYTSNTVLTDMLVMWNSDFCFAELETPTAVTSYTTDSSTCTIKLEYNKNYEYGISGNNGVQSYKLFLYDGNKKLIESTPEMYDWDSNLYWGHRYTFYDLKDNTTYYVRARITLNGGYTLYRGLPTNPNAYVPIYVHYADAPTPSSNFTLQNKPEGVNCNLDLTGVMHTRVVFSRTKYGESNYLQIADITTDDSNVTTMDGYAIPKNKYTYRAIVYNGDTVVATYYNTISYTNSCIKISDIYGSYTALGDITKHPISRNNRGAILESMDSVFPRNIINGSPDYDSGNVDGIFTTTDEDCNVVTDSESLTIQSNIMRKWLNNGRAKLLTYYTGEAWVVCVSEIQTTDPENNDVYHTTFHWTQIGDATKIDEYARLGLVITE